VTRFEALMCGDLYHQFKERGWNRYKDAPKKGICVPVEYFDNQMFVGKNRPSTVLLLHGSPGSYNDFLPLITRLTQIGVRVIAPNFPDFNQTVKTKHYRHSPEEKREYIRTVLEYAEVDRIDLLGSHSSGVYPAVKLWREQRGVEVRSLAWMNPVGHQTILPMQPYWLTRGLVKAYQMPWARFALDKIGTPILKATGNGFGKQGFSHTVLGGCSIHYCNKSQFVEDVQSLRDKRVPLMVTFADNDKVMNQRMNSTLATLLGGNYDSAYHYNENGELVSDTARNWFPLIRFKSGGHFAYLKYPLVVNKFVESTLESVSQSSALDSEEESLDTTMNKYLLPKESQLHSLQ
jgi:pimeloyl-ACP methyl ester carboxylesterase